MSDTLWPCHVCNGAGVRNVGSKGHCGAHLAALYSTFNKNVFAFNGVGNQNGVMRPDYGPAHTHLECNACEATWVGIPGESCNWCKTSHQQLIAHQAELVTQPPDIEPNNAQYGAAIEAWSYRLDVAVNAGVIDQHLAERLITNETHRAA
jgi:hypothetical protein